MAGCFPQVSKKKFGKRGIDASRRFMWLCSIGFLINAILIKKWSKLTASLVYEDDVGVYTARHLKPGIRRLQVNTVRRSSKVNAAPDFSTFSLNELNPF